MFRLFFTYEKILVALVIEISTHLLVHIECQVFMAVGYVPVMCAYVCDPYDIVIHVIMILSPFSNYIDHNSDIEQRKICMSIGNMQFQHTLSKLNISQLNYSSLQENDFRNNHMLEKEKKIKKVSMYSWPTGIIAYFMIGYILRYIICYNKTILMEMYICGEIHFMYEVWYMYVFSCSEGREGSGASLTMLKHSFTSIILYMYLLCLFIIIHTLRSFELILY